MRNILLLLSTIIFISCSSDDDAGDVITNEFKQIEIILPQSDWRVSEYFSNGTDQTIEFESFDFTFTEDGTVEVQNDLFTEVGTWNYVSTAEAGEQLLLQFSQTATPFDKLSKNWTILSLSISNIELSTVDANGEIDRLTFTKL